MQGIGCKVSVPAQAPCSPSAIYSVQGPLCSNSYPLLVLLPCPFSIIIVIIVVITVPELWGPSELNA